MACIARLFGGLRTADLHSLTWESLDCAGGRFSFGWAPRRKTGVPQLLEVPEMLRPILRDLWERTGRPEAGVLFPARKGKRLGQQKRKGSHADALRRDLRRAFGLEVWDEPAREWKAADRSPTARERELLEDGTFTRRVDFHGWRRSFSQALADGGVNAQQAKALAGHATEAAHDLYLQNPGKLQRLPERALPAIWLDTTGVRSSLPAPQKLREIRENKRRMGRLFRPAHSIGS